WILKTGTGFENPVLDFEIPRWILKTGTGFENPVLDFEIPRWILKTGTGFENPVLDFEIPRWILKTGTGFENPALDFEIPRCMRPRLPVVRAMLPVILDGSRQALFQRHARLPAGHCIEFRGRRVDAADIYGFLFGG